MLVNRSQRIVFTQKLTKITQRPKHISQVTKCLFPSPSHSYHICGEMDHMLGLVSLMAMLSFFVSFMGEGDKKYGSPYTIVLFLTSPVKYLCILSAFWDDLSRGFIGLFSWWTLLVVYPRHFHPCRVASLRALLQLLYIYYILKYYCLRTALVLNSYRTTRKV